jgi:hypothetical protein
LSGDIEDECASKKSGVSRGSKAMRSLSASKGSTFLDGEAALEEQVRSKIVQEGIDFGREKT